MRMAIERQPAASSVILPLVAVEAVIFLVAALQHLGVPIPLGFTVLAEPYILPAAIVEGSIGLVFLASAAALFTGQEWAPALVLGAHFYSLAGVLLGIFVLAMGFGPRTLTNDLYHIVMLLLAIGGLALLLGANSREEVFPAAFFHWAIRITGLVQIVLGGLFWLTQNDALVPVHILVGSLLVLSLWTLALLALRAGADQKLAVVALVWGLIVVVLGLTQAQLLVGPFHWVIEGLHLLVGLGAMGQGEGLARRLKPAHAPAV